MSAERPSLAGRNRRALLLNHEQTDDGRRRWLPRAELVRRLRVAQADSGLSADLERLAGDTTDDLDPVR